MLDALVGAHQNTHQDFNEVKNQNPGSPPRIFHDNGEDEWSLKHIQYMQTLGPEFPINQRDEPDKIITYLTKKIEENQGECKFSRESKFGIISLLWKIRRGITLIFDSYKRRK